MHGIAALLPLHRTSPLYQADLQAKMDNYYNTSSSQDMSPNGAPYGKTSWVVVQTGKQENAENNITIL